MTAPIIEKDQTMFNDYLFTCLHLMTFHFDLFESLSVLALIRRMTNDERRKRDGIDLEHLNTDKFVRFPFFSACTACTMIHLQSVSTTERGEKTNAS